MSIFEKNTYRFFYSIHILLALPILMLSLFFSCSNRSTLTDRISDFNTRLEYSKAYPLHISDSKNKRNLFMFKSLDGSDSNAYVIQTHEALLLIDPPQYKKNYQELLKFAKFLNSKFEAIIISSISPESFVGLSFFSQKIPSYAPSEIKKYIDEYGLQIYTNRIKYGLPFSIQYPPNFYSPLNSINDALIVDEMTFKIINLNNSVIPQSIIYVSDFESLFTSDLLFYNSHIPITNPKNNIETIELINTLHKTLKNVLILPSRQEPIEFSNLETIRSYVNISQQVLSSNPSYYMYKQKMNAFYPNFSDLNYVLNIMKEFKVFN